MGIPLDTEFGTNCSRCFPAGETPKHGYISIAGIIALGGWQERFGPPPNRIFAVTQVSGCQWSGVMNSPNGYITYHADDSGSYVVVGPYPGVYAFRGGNATRCKTYFVNQNPSAGVFSGGVARVLFLSGNTGNAAELQTVADLINHDTKDPAKADFLPVDETHLMAQFCNQKEATNILVKIDLDEL